MNNSLDLMRARLEFRGGAAQQDRMIKDKRKTLDKVILYSYQGALVQKIDSNEQVPALINPNKVKQDYDDKIISISYEYGFSVGTVFEWANTNTRWLIYLQDLTELAYFKGDIRKCNYKINWLDSEDKEITHSVYAAIRGPVETRIEYLQKNDISLDKPNHSLNLLIPATKEALEHFRKYSKFYIQPQPEGDQTICWRVEATDTISMPGIIELTAVEYYINEDKDDTDQGLVDTWVEPIPQPQDSGIVGEIFIKPKMTYTYIYNGTEIPNWSYDTRLPLEVQIDGNQLTLKWKTTYTGQFVLTCADQSKTIVVESLF